MGVEGRLGRRIAEKEKKVEGGREGNGRLGKEAEGKGREQKREN